MPKRIEPLCDCAPEYFGLLAHHVIIGGFRQSRAQLAGVDRVYAALQRFNAPDVRVSPPLRWNENWDAEAEFIARHRLSHPKGEPPIVALYAYSWGVGWGAVQLATKLERLGIPVEVLVSCDGVYRHGYRAGNWRAFWRWSRIHLPASVRKAHVFLQENGWLRGHSVYLAGKPVTPNIISRVGLNGFSDRANHYNLDESNDWIAKCKTVAINVERLVEQRRHR